MQFNSFVFILVLLPATAILYFLLNKIHFQAGKILLIVSSIVFYAYSDWTTFIILGISLLVNWAFALFLRKTGKWKKGFMAVPIVINVALLLYFKYLNFAITNINHFFGKEYALQELVLPLGISFFTFQQIAYIVAVYREEIPGNSIIDYATYILYFPKILMGPLMEPADFWNQINNQSLKSVNWDNIAYGVKIFSLGLFKKVMLADVFANAVSWGYTNIDAATSMDWILVMLFYTFEIYFDFSGYSDMAVGASMVLNITLPMNFDSPYKAISIRDFWKRWHISLTKFFTKYIYIPLGGSRKGIFFTILNTMIVFVVSGIWHGANWTFVLWGVLHGAFSIFDRLFEKAEEKVFEPVRWMLSFTVVNVLWLLFRSDSITQWKHILKGILSFKSTAISDGLKEIFAIQETTFLADNLHLQRFVTTINGFWMLLYILVAFGICLVPENNYRQMKHKSAVTMVLAAIAFVWGFICLSGESVFVYFNF